MQVNNRRVFPIHTHPPHPVAFLRVLRRFHKKLFTTVPPLHAETIYQ